MQVKTNELIGPALNWAVAKCGGVEARWSALYEMLFAIGPRWVPYQPSNDWSQGGPIIEREGISWHCGNESSWHAYAFGSADNISGPTPLIAAMRCYVASKLGEEVEVPAEMA